MPITSVANLKINLKHKERLLCLDLGRKTIGLAISDISCTIATPLCTIIRTKFKEDVKKLFTIIDLRYVNGLIVGLPVNMNGIEGSSCQSVRQFVTNLLNFRELHIAFWDERLSTIAVTRTLLEADVSRLRRHKVIDKIAATYIMQGALDYIQAVTNSSI
ncbi:MAG: Holliday junction resolvase RuvX [Rhodospirillaceae bacterium]|jgi:putative Holliday junction resolvase|nr:Holliday junction resolvase RuvX [Rhodospirillaceae bacterium]